RVYSGGRCPTICARIVSPARIQIGEELILSTPDDHFAVGPYCGVTDPPVRCVGDRHSSPTIRAGVISAAGFLKACATPYDHFATRPCRGLGSSTQRCV